ncbi:MAG: EAL domain-containing protein [Gammaproteobacteria bacterium]|nr:EAL domain-containing protein [Gammaproteobacteria bacterium]NNM20177.1 EAL domain-containing protein [Gammaproteobacteria bacterium]
MSMIGVGLVALVLTWFVTRRSFLRRIERLNLELGNIAEHQEFRQRVTETNRDDELGRLERSVNDVFDAIDSRDRADDVRERLFRNLAEGVQEAIIVLRNKVIYANPRAAAMRGVRQQDLINKSALEIVHPDFREQIADLFDRHLAGKEVPDRFEVQLLNREGEGVWVEGTTSIIDYEGKPALLFAAFDVSRRKNSAEQLSREKDRAATTLQSISYGVITADIDGQIDYMNAAAEAMLDCDSADARGRELLDIVSLVDETDRKPLRDPVAQCLQQHRRISLGRRALMLVGTDEYSVELSVSPIGGGPDMHGCVIVIHDVTELRGLARQMSYQASHDALTGLFNRREFERRVDEALKTAQASGTGHVVCYLDLDRFKAVNDTCGHMAGDNMLREVAGLIREQVRDSDSVARLGGDEFGMLLFGCPLEKARQIADDACRAVEDYRFVWRDRIFQVGVSIGLVEIGHESGTVVDALMAADSACYVAKQSRSRVHVYSARDEAVARNKGEIAWLQRLQVALKDNKFELHAQPIVSVDGKVTDGPAFEVLLRLHDDGGREIAPGEFIEAAERYKLMPRIDRWVIETAFSALGSGGLRLPDNRSCTINLSGQTIGDGQFLEFVVECLDRTGVIPDRICFELTESSVITNIGHARRFIEVLHGMGCRFALDDFGSGLGSLANLRELSMDFIKIDGSFLKNLETDAVNQAMVTAMIKLARTLDIKVVAEQVEDRESLDAIRKLGVDFVQGYAIGRPRPLPVAHAA